MKKNITFRLDPEKYRKFSEATNGRPSEFVDRIISMFLGMLEKEQSVKLDEMRLELTSLRIARSLLLSRLREVEQRISELEEHIREESTVSGRIAKDEVFRELIQKLNDIIRECDFEFHCTWQRSLEVRKRLEEIDFKVTRDWLLRHIERLFTWG